MLRKVLLCQLCGSCLLCSAAFCHKVASAPLSGTKPPLLYFSGTKPPLLHFLQKTASDTVPRPVNSGTTAAFCYKVARASLSTCPIGTTSAFSLLAGCSGPLLSLSAELAVGLTLSRRYPLHTWALSLTNFIRMKAEGAELRQLQLQELDAFRLEVYDSSKLYKEKTKAFHDGKLVLQRFKERDQVLLFNSRLKLFPGKLKSRWMGPFTISRVLPYGVFEVFEEQTGRNLKVNGHRVKKYLHDVPFVRAGTSIDLDEPAPGGGGEAKQKN
ncbi:hypothetical protein M569_03669 [Genlisea aurea]|uniref:Uncharacterized protein n=1 Tax=Genlisea aurea TaxID=192259 RepID=S8CW88_9LAMI|nr:hypothetical protein M569_03669 [Genlisea aurea]